MALVAAVAMLAAQRGDVVTLSVAGASVRDAVAAIAKESGEDLTVADSANSLTLIVDVRGAPLDDLLAKIAQATHGTWEKDGDKRRLSVTGDALKEQGERERALIEAAIKEQQARKAKEVGDWAATKQGLVATADQVVQILQGFDSTTEAYNRLFAACAPTPLYRFASRAAAEFPASELATLWPGERRVYTTKGTGKQWELPTGMQRLFDGFLKEQADWTLVAKASAAAHPVRFSFDPRAFADNEQMVPDSFFVFVTAPPYSHSVSLTVVIVTKAGSVIGNARATFDLSATRASVTPGDSSSVVPILAEECALPTVRSLYSERAMPDGRLIADMNRAIVAKLAAAEHSDPLQLYVGPVVCRTARAIGQNLVALLPDEALDWQFASAPALETVATGQVFEWMQRSWMCEVTQEGGWTVATPKFFVQARAKYLDRKPLAELFGSAHRTGWFSRDALSRYVTEQRCAWPIPDSVYRMSLLVGSVELSSPSTRLHWNWTDPLLLPALLSESERQLAVNGTLRFGQISPQGRARIESQLYDSVSSLSPPLNTSLQQEDASGLYVQNAGQVLALLKPDGIPSDAKVTIQAGESPGVALMLTGMRTSYWFDMEGASTALSSHTPNAFDMAQPLSVQRVNLSIDLGDGWTLQTGTVFPNGPDPKKWQLFDKLDPELRRLLFGG